MIEYVIAIQDMSRKLRIL